MAATGLFGLLEIGTSGLRAARAGIATAGRNTANVNTPGYTRQSVRLSSMPGDPKQGGVRVDGVLRSDSDLLSARERTNDGHRGFADSLRTSLEGLESTLAGGPSSVVEAIAELFGGITELSALPTDPSLRAQVVDRARTVGTRFNQASTAIASARAGASDGLIRFVEQANRLAATMAEQNRGVIGPEPDPALLDARAATARELSTLTGGQAILDGKGQMRFTLASGQALVDGPIPARFETEGNAGGDVRIFIQTGASRMDVTHGLNGGQMGGLVEFRDGPLSTVSRGLDQLAYDLATQLNTVHQGFQGADGNSGRDFFQAPSAVTGAAGALAVSSALVADPSLIGSATPGSGPGDNAGLLAMANLRDARLAAGNTRTFLDQGIDLLAGVGASTASAGAELDLRQAESEALAGQRDGLSGVSTEDELIKLGEFQRAHQAATRFLATVDELYQDLLNRL